MRYFACLLSFSLGVTMTTSAASAPNRLIHEKSPFLLQHAYNPVDWYPWGPEAFEKARKEDKPILVSIGYSTCHWCHVMEHESYEDPAVAAIMNKYLVNIKVDREERPDVDKIYMTAVSAMTGSGGWPLNMFLTSELKPIYGGTYFPPVSKWGQPAWKDVVTQIGESWKDPEHRKKMLEAASSITESLKKYASASRRACRGRSVWLGSGFKSFHHIYDAARGGFGRAPKFPMPVYHNFLMRYYARTKNKAALEMSLHTLREMAKGGIYDQLGGGFARYSTDANWHVPHFEKMLYDNAQLAVNYLEAYQITHDEEFKRVAEETLAYIQRDMTHAGGGFYSAEDADSLPAADAKEKKEGAFYVWERSGRFWISRETKRARSSASATVFGRAAMRRAILTPSLRIKIFSISRIRWLKLPGSLVSRSPTRRFCSTTPNRNCLKPALGGRARIWTTRSSADGTA